MDSVLYEQFGNVEVDHWWWVGRRTLVFKILTSLTSLSPHPRVLDVGCGTGALLALLPEPWEGYGIDSAPEAIDQSRKRGLKNVTLSQPGEIPFPAGFFDAVLLLDVLEHIEPESDVLRHISGCLRKGGYLIVTVPAFGWLWTRWDDLNFHKRRYARKELMRVLTASGFSVSFCSYMNFLLFPLALARWAIEKIRFSKESELPVGAETPATVVNTVLKKIFCAEQPRLMKKRRFPWGSSLIAIAKWG